MRLPTRLPLPGRRALFAVAGLALGAAVASVAADVAGIDDERLARIGQVIAFLAGLIGLALVADAAVGGWRLHRQPITFVRRLPAAFALGRVHPIGISVRNPGAGRWNLIVFDHAAPTLNLRQLPARAALPPRATVDLSYEVTPTRRGRVAFEPAALRVRSALGLVEWQLRAGAAEARQVHPDFAALSRYAWLAGDRRLSEAGFKTFAARGAGTDFKQLGDYTPGMPTRHIDWNASLRHRRPVVREFQDDRDQSVVILLDCGRRMRADEQAAGAGLSHFDQALNALLLLAYVALKEGDAVGALTFGHAAAARRHVEPAKGLATLSRLVARLHDLEPEASHTDYTAGARDLMTRVGRRSLVVILTDFRDEACDELEAALALLRTRHLVLVASLRERVLGELAAAPLADDASITAVASAHGFAQARQDAFQRLGARDRFMVDADPADLATALVNRYHAVKRARLL